MFPGRNNNVPPEYRYRVLLEAIGNDAEIAKAIETFGFEAPSIFTIRGWRKRDSIPSRWMPLVLTYALRQGIIENPTQLFKRPKRRDMDTL